MAQRKKVQRNTNCQLSHLGVRVQQHARKPHYWRPDTLTLWHRLQPETRLYLQMKSLCWLIRVEICALKMKHSCHFKWLLKLQIPLQTLFYYSSSLSSSAAVMTPLLCILLLACNPLFSWCTFFCWAKMLHWASLSGKKCSWGVVEPSLQMWRAAELAVHGAGLNTNT